MYVAQRELKVIPLGTEKAIIYRPGDVIPDFDKWDLVVQKAHLNLEYVTEAPSKAPAPSKPVVQATEAPIPFKCDLCPTKEFKSPKALKTHTTLAHKK